MRPHLFPRKGETLMARKVVLPAVVNGYTLSVDKLSGVYIGILTVGGTVVMQTLPCFTRREACLQTLALAQDLGTFPGEEGVESVERAMREWARV